MKNCPFCAEEIQDAAIVCRHCRKDLRPEVVKAAKGLGKVGLWLLLIVGGFVAFIVIGALTEVTRTGKITDRLSGCALTSNTPNGRQAVAVTAIYDHVAKSLTLSTDTELSDAQATDVETRCVQFLRREMDGLVTDTIDFNHR